MTHFLTRLFGARTPAAPKPAHRVSLSVEMLETRATPSGGLKIVDPLMHVDEHASQIHRLMEKLHKRDLFALQNMGRIF